MEWHASLWYQYGLFLVAAPLALVGVVVGSSGISAFCGKWTCDRKPILPSMDDRTLGLGLSGNHAQEVSQAGFLLAMNLCRPGPLKQVQSE